MNSRSLARFPVAVRAEWRSKIVTTDPPRLTPHEEWRLEVCLDSDAPFRRAALMYRCHGLEWGLSLEPPSTRSVASMHFFPYDWSSSDDVQISFGFRRAAVADSALKEDPRPHVTLLLPETAPTGQIIPVAEVPRHRLQVAILPIAEEDIERRRHGRWRVRPRLAGSLPPELRQLADGSQTGASKASLLR